MRQLFAIASKLYRSIKPVRSEGYKAFVRSWPCIACGTMTMPRDAAHVGPHGIGQKASDLDAIPACRKCHARLHKLGPLAFQAAHDLDFREAIALLHHMYTLRFGRLPEEDLGRRAA